MLIWDQFSLFYHHYMAMGDLILDQHLEPEYTVLYRSLLWPICIQRQRWKPTILSSFYVKLYQTQCYEMSVIGLINDMKLTLKQGEITFSLVQSQIM